MGTFAGWAVVGASCAALFAIHLPKPIADMARWAFNKPRPGPTRRPYFDAEASDLMENYTFDWLVLMLEQRGLDHEMALAEAWRRDAAAAKLYADSTMPIGMRTTLALGILTSGPDATLGD